MARNWESLQIWKRLSGKAAKPTEGSEMQRMVNHDPEYASAGLERELKVHYHPVRLATFEHRLQLQVAYDRATGKHQIVASGIELSAQQLYIGNAALPQPA